MFDLRPPHAMIWQAEAITHHNDDASASETFAVCVSVKHETEQLKMTTDYKPKSHKVKCVSLR